MVAGWSFLLHCPCFFFSALHKMYYRLIFFFFFYVFFSTFRRIIGVVSFHFFFRFCLVGFYIKFINIIRCALWILQQPKHIAHWSHCFWFAITNHEVAIGWKFRIHAPNILVQFFPDIFIPENDLHAVWIDECALVRIEMMNLRQYRATATAATNTNKNKNHKNQRQNTRLWKSINGFLCLFDIYTIQIDSMGNMYS